MRQGSGMPRKPHEEGGLRRRKQSRVSSGAYRSSKTED